MMPKHPGAEPPLAARVHAALARSGFHSGTDLARELRVSRSAVWKAIESLRTLGVVVHAVRNRGYKLAFASVPLNPARIRAALAEDVRARVRHLETHWSLPSTNAALLERADLPIGFTDVLAAEYQTAGRGRRGRAWLAPPGGSICLSLSWGFPQVPRDLGGLALAVGVCARRALQAGITESIALKWPNDLIVRDRKLGGILIEMRAESAGPTYVVIGLGLNLTLGPELAAKIAATGTQATDLKSLGGDPQLRNELVAAIVAQIVRGLVEFEHEGLRPFATEWKSADALKGRAVHVQTAASVIRGLARGIDAGGALLVETAQGTQRLLSGDVSVRAER